MRRVVTGVGPDGRSMVLSDGPPPSAFGASETSSMTRVDRQSIGAIPAKQAVVHDLWTLSTDAHRGSEDASVGAAEIVFDAPPGATKWIVTEMGPQLFTPMHDTPTIDYGFVIKGEVELGLDAGCVVLHAGDAVLVDGVKHAWRAGPDGCVIATVLVGLAESDRT
jgi:quercetin dioxygenase-like cupin family protein